MSQERQHLVAIHESQLSAVTFVRDYVQLHFDGPTINAFTLPAVVVRDSILVGGDVGYRDALCARVGSTVVDAYAEPRDALRIWFSDGSSFSISLRPEDRQTAEAALYLDGQSKEGRLGSGPKATLVRLLLGHTNPSRRRCRRMAVAHDDDGVVRLAHVEQL